MIKKISILFLTIFFTLILNLNVYAADKNVSKIDINGKEIRIIYEITKDDGINVLGFENPEDLIGEVKIPNTVAGKNVVSLNFDSFKDAINMTSVVIPKTLKSGPVAPVFTNCTNLKTVKLEDGLTIVPSYLLATTGIESIDIPSSVKKIDNNAFANCTKLKSVKLGSIEEISFDVFKNCTSLTEITIPKTLKTGPVAPVFTNCTNLKTAKLEDGLTIVPSYLLATTGIESIDIPSSVQKIQNNAFTNCKDLKKVTILENVNEIGFFVTQPKTDSVFINHNDDLTIYCYEGSLAAKYAIGTNIKYKYLTKSVEENKDTTLKNDSKEGTATNVNVNASQPDTTVIDAPKLPQTGENITIIAAIVLVAIGGIYSYIRFKNYKNI